MKIKETTVTEMTMTKKNETKRNETMEKTMTKEGYALVAEKFEEIREAAYAAMKSYAKGQKIAWLDSNHFDCVFSDVYTKILFSGDSFNPAKASLRTWVWTVSVNALKDYLRKTRGWVPIEVSDEEEDEVRIAQFGVDGLTPEENFIGKERAEGFFGFLETRSELDRIIFERSMSGYSPKELAEEFGLTPQAVSMRLFKIRSTYAKTA